MGLLAVLAEGFRLLCLYQCQVRWLAEQETALLAPQRVSGHDLGMSDWTVWVYTSDCVGGVPYLA